MVAALLAKGVALVEVLVPLDLGDAKQKVLSMSVKWNFMSMGWMVQ